MHLSQPWPSSMCCRCGLSLYHKEHTQWPFGLEYDRHPLLPRGGTCGGSNLCFLWFLWEKPLILGLAWANSSTSHTPHRVLIKTAKGEGAAWEQTESSLWVQVQLYLSQAPSWRTYHVCVAFLIAGWKLIDVCNAKLNKWVMSKSVTWMSVLTSIAIAMYIH